MPSTASTKHVQSSNAQNLKCTALSYRTLTRHSIQSCPAPPWHGCETRQPLYTQRHRFHKDKSFKAVLRHPLGARRGSLPTLIQSAIETQILIHRKRYTVTDYHEEKSFKAALRRPPVGREMRQPIFTSSSKQTAVETSNTESTRLQSQS